MSGRARIGLVGLTGYAAELGDLLLAEQEHPEGRTAYAASFAIDAGDHPERCELLAGHGVRTHGSFEAVLADPELDAVWLPVPIHLHRPMGEAVLYAEKALVLEKPVAGSTEDHRALAACADEHGLPLLIGFQDVYAPSTQRLKALLLSGELGTPTVASVHGSWPRTDSYFSRNAAAGRLAVEGTPVRDSPMNNAMAHFVNLALFLMGDAPHAAAMPESVGGWLARAHEIESFDTCSVRAALKRTAGEENATLVVNLTHAAARHTEPVIEIDTDRGTLRWSYQGQASFTHAFSGRIEKLTDPEPPRPHMARTIGAILNGDTPELHHADAANALAHTTLVELTHAAGAITDLRDAATIPPDPDAQPRDVPGLADALSRAAAERTTVDTLGFHPGAS